MSSTTITEAERQRRRRTYKKYSLAAVALLGIGAAATSAAWTDDAWFSATASAQTVKLEGSLVAGGPYELADTEGDAIVIPDTAFGDMAPAEVRTITLYLHNDSSGDLDVSAGTANATGEVFSGPNPVAVAIGPLTPASPLVEDGEASVVLTLTAPDWGNTAQDLEYQGATGDLTVQFTGTP